MSFTIIACVGKNRELGANGSLIWHIPEDMKFFKSNTMGHKVVMGRKTYESLPAAGLPGREMITLSRSGGKSVEDVLAEDSDEEIFIIGGGSIYEQFLPHASRILLTEVDTSSDKADTYFPEFDRSKYTRKVIGKGNHNGLDYEFVEYKRK